MSAPDSSWHVAILHISSYALLLASAVHAASNVHKSWSAAACRGAHVRSRPQLDAVTSYMHAPLKTAKESGGRVDKNSWNATSSTRLFLTGT